MKVTLKRNIGDVVWVMKGNKPYEGKITRIRYTEFLNNVTYDNIVKMLRFTIDDDYDGYDDNQVFDSKDELLASL